MRLDSQSVLKLCLVVLFFSCTLRVHAQSIVTLHPPPKTAFTYADTTRYRLSAATMLVLPDTMSPQLSAAVNRLEAELQRRCGLVLPHVNFDYYIMSMPPGKQGLVILPDTSTKLSYFQSTLFAHGESAPAKAGGYVIDVRSNECVLYCQSATDAAANAVASFLQLLRKSDASLPSCHVWDQPDYPNRWVFSQHNMLVNGNVKVLNDMADTMATFKLNGIQQNDFKLGILDRMTASYFKNVDSLKRIWADRSIEVIPGVCGLGWSSTILYNDPQLAEGIEARTRYVMEGDTGRLLQNVNAILPNGDFESVDSQGRLTGYSYYDTCFHQDRSVYHSGSASAKASNMVAGSNARCTRSLSLQPHEYYSLSVWMKTQNCNADEFRLLVLADTGNAQYRAVTFTALNISPNTDWTKVEVFFNTLEYSKVIVYAGMWGARGGSLWLDDFQIKAAGLCNVLRRQGTPLSAQSLSGGKVYQEGLDFASISDSWWNTKSEEIGPYHTPPTLRLLSGSAIHNGDTVELRYYHPFAAVSDNSGNGSMMACVSEDTLYKILDKQIRWVSNLFRPSKYFLGHDEIRNMNRDMACLRRGLSPAALLADNMRRCDSLITNIDAGSERFMWSDMLDSLHNAVNNYYLVNGDLRGDWAMAPKSLCMMNWNAGAMNASLDFFSRQGYPQMTAPFFTSGNSSSALNWRVAQDDVQKLRGMMYVTWTNEYRYLPLFAYYVWGAGAYVIHPPLDSTCFATGTAKVVATITADPYNSNDIVYGAELVLLQSNVSSKEKSYSMTKSGSTTWIANLPLDGLNWFRYTIRARTSEGFLREIPGYLVKRPGHDTLSSVTEEAAELNMELRPQPSTEDLELSFHCPPGHHWQLDLFDLQGRCLKSSQALHQSASAVEQHWDLSELSSGSYLVQLSIDGQQKACRRVVHFH